MDSSHIASHHEAWNKGKLVGQKAPFKLREIWAIRIRLEMQGRVRELALFDLGIDSKLRACDLVSLRVRDVCHGDRAAARAIVLQAEDPAPRSVRDHASDSGGSRGMDQAGRPEIRKLPVPEPCQQITAPGHAAVRAHRRWLGGGNRSRSRGIRDAFNASDEAYSDLPEDQESPRGPALAWPQQT